MTEKEFISQIDELLARHKRRLRKLEAVRRGDAKLKRVVVKSYRVRAYSVSRHVRWL